MIEDLEPWQMAWAIGSILWTLVFLVFVIGGGKRGD
jgi:hypothetical protein